MNKFAATLLSILLAAHLTACTSSESREDDVTAPTEETAAVDSELEKVDGASDETNAGFVDEQLPEQALGEKPADTPMVDTAAPEQTVDTSTPAPDSMASTDMAPPPVESAPVDNSVVASEPVNTEVPMGVDTGSTTESKPVEIADTPAPKPSAPLARVNDVPTREGAHLLNAYYVARPGDTFGKVAKMIYGSSSKQAELKEMNPNIKTLRPGVSKIYYNSPTRPTDETAMRSYYEDQGMAAETYIAKDGDDLKKVSKKLLGYKDAWKEVWSTNRDLESKGSLTAGTEFKYFAGVKADVPAETSTKVADAAPVMNEMAPAQTETAPPAPEMAMNEPPPPPPPADLPPPPDMNAGGAAASGTVAMNEPPPPPPPAEMAPPPPPPVEAPPPPPPAPEMKKAPHADAAAEGFSQDDMMMALGAAGILAAGIAAIMVIRKRRQQKEMASAFGDTQVGA